MNNVLGRLGAEQNANDANAGYAFPTLNGFRFNHMEIDPLFSNCSRHAKIETYKFFVWLPQSSLVLKQWWQYRSLECS
jgi:hypothetical protein